MRVAVVGHVEWVELVRVEHMPGVGEIVHARPWWEGPGGGGPDAAMQLLKLAGEVTLFTALGDDDLGHRAKEEMEELGLRVEVAWRDEATRRAFVHVDSSGERTITVIGDRLAPQLVDDLPWHELDGADAVYLTAGDRGAISKARSARVLVATARILDELRDARIELDALVASSTDPGESYSDGDLDPPPRLVALTAGLKGGRYRRAKDWIDFDPPHLEGAIVDRYGAGDAFAAGLTFGLGAGLEDHAAIALATDCSASVLLTRGPFPAS